MKGLTFSQPMMLAWLEGRKSVTRRLMNPQPEIRNGFVYGLNVGGSEEFFRREYHHFIKPRYRPGETVYIKETWAHWFDHNKSGKVFYKADGQDFTTGEKMLGWKWRSPRFMPEWASRSHALILSARPERIQEITEEEADKEGFGGDFPHKVMPEMFDVDDSGLSIPECFARLWETLHKRSWTENSWIWRYELEVRP